MADTDSDFTYYHYEPSLVAAIVVTCLFAVSSALHIYQFTRTRAMYMIPLIIGAIIEVVGFGGRIWSSIEAPDYTLPPYIIQAILILIAPALLAATVYMVLGYVILAVDGERHSMIQKKFLTKIFVIGDIFSFLIQSTGMLIDANSTALLLMSQRCWSAHKEGERRSDDRQMDHRRRAGDSIAILRFLHGRLCGILCPYQPQTNSGIQVWRRPMAPAYVDIVHCQHPHHDPIGIPCYRILTGC